MTRRKKITFEDLWRDVVEKDICSMCYSCVSFCSAVDYDALTVKRDKPAYLNEDNCLKCGICYMICPRTGELEEPLRKKYGFKPLLGHYEDIRSLRTTDSKIRRVCTDGGVVTSILKFLIDHRNINGAVVARKERLWSNEPMIATTYEDLLEAAGTSLSPSKGIEQMGYLGTYVPIMKTIRDLPLEMASLAVVGTPCQIKALRNMQVLRLTPSHMVKFTVGLFCYENFHIPVKGPKRTFLEKKLGGKLEDILKINLKEDFIAKFRGGRKVHVDLDELGLIVRPGCRACTDFTNLYADISVGGIGSPDGYTTTIIRNTDSKRIVEEAIKQGYLEEMGNKAKFKIENIERMASRKLESGQAYLKARGAPLT